MAPFSLITLANDPYEQGEWAARTALEVLDGKKIDSIKVTANRKATTYLNMPLAKKLRIIFPIDLLERAILIGKK